MRVGRKTPGDSGEDTRPHDDVRWGRDPGGPDESALILAARLTIDGLDGQSDAEERDDLRRLLLSHLVGARAAYAGWSVLAEEYARVGDLEAASHAVHQAVRLRDTTTEAGRLLSAALVRGVRDICSAFERVGRMGETVALTSAAADVAEAVWAADPVEATSLYGAALGEYARSLAWSGGMTDAIGFNAVAIELSQRSPEPGQLAELLALQADWLRHLGRHPEATEVQGLVPAALAAQPRDPAMTLADRLIGVCLALTDLGDPGSAERFLVSGVRATRRSAAGVGDQRATRARLCSGLALVRSRTAQHHRAVTSSTNALELLRALDREGRLGDPVQLTEALRLHARILDAAGHPQQAIAACREAVDVLRTLQRGHPEEYATAYVLALSALADRLVETDPSAAVDIAMAAEDLACGLDSPEEYDGLRSANATVLARALDRAGQPEDAAAARSLAESLRRAEAARTFSAPVVPVVPDTPAQLVTDRVTPPPGPPQNGP